MEAPICADEEPWACHVRPLKPACFVKPHHRAKAPPQLPEVCILRQKLRRDLDRGVRLHHRQEEEQRRLGFVSADDVHSLVREGVTLTTQPPLSRHGI